MNKNWLWVSVLAVLASCSTDVGNFEIGSDLVESESKVLLVDTFSINLSTVTLDSLVTMAPTTALVGKYTDPNIGITEMRHFFNVDLTDNYSALHPSKAEDEQDVILDSITVKFAYSGFSIGDTLSNVTFSLHRLTEELEPITNEYSIDYLLNTSSFEYDPTPLGTYTFLPIPSEDSIEFRLNQEFGEEILDWIWNYTSDGGSVDMKDDFRETMKGFVMVADAGANVILGFDNNDSKNLNLKIYTHKPGYDIEDTEYYFNVTSEGTNFNQSITDRSGTLFDGLVMQDEKLPSTATNDITYIQGTAGVLTRIDFPSLPKVFTFENQVLIKAELELTPAIQNNFRELPTSLNFLTTDKFNRYSTSNTLTVTTSSGATVNVTASLQANYVTDEFKYVADISSFLLAELADYNYSTDLGLFVSFPSTTFLNSCPLFFIQDGSNNTTKPKLNLYFLQYE